MTTCRLLLCTLLLLTAARVRAAELGWAPERTWLFVVGVLHWKHNETFGSFPLKKRRDAELVEFFKGAGVPESQIVYLQDRQATQKRIDSAFAGQLEKINEGDMLLVYYAGHGYRSADGDDVYLASYDAGDKGVAGWAINSIPQTIEEHSDVSRVMWLIDCCYSGQAAEAVKTRGDGPAYACATSSMASESSTGHWTFTESFLDAIRGAGFVDLNRDGRTTMSEFASHAEGDMRLGEEQLMSFATAGQFDAEMVLAAANPVAHPRVGERVKVEADGEWYTARILEPKGDGFRVRFVGYDEDDDVVVDAARMRPITTKQYAVGSNVDVLWKKKWYAARVLKVKDGVHFITYDGYESDWDEWVSSKRIRARARAFSTDCSLYRSCSEKLIA